MPRLACFDSPGPFTTQPITATFIVSTPGAPRARPASARAGRSGCPPPCAGRSVDVVRPQPGHAVTCGAKLRSPSDCRICCATSTSSVRSPFGLGVSETRIVSPIPFASRMDSAAALATMPLHPHPRLGEAEVQRIVAARGEPPVDLHEVRHVRDLGRDEDAGRGRSPDLLGQLGRAQRALRASPRCRRPSRRAARRRAALSSIICVSRSWSSEPQFTPMRTGLSCSTAICDDGAEVLVAPLAADVAGVDAVLGERPRARRDTSRAAGARCSGSRRRSGRRRPGRRGAATISGTAAAASSLFTVTRTSCEPAVGERGDLRGGRGGVGGVGVRHGLHDDRMRRPDGDGADVRGDGGAARSEGHGCGGSGNE